MTVDMNVHELILSHVNVYDMLLSQEMKVIEKCIKYFQSTQTPLEVYQHIQKIKTTSTLKEMLPKKSKKSRPAVHKEPVVLSPEQRCIARTAKFEQCTFQRLSDFSFCKKHNDHMAFGTIHDPMPEKKSGKRPAQVDENGEPIAKKARVESAVDEEGNKIKRVRKELSADCRCIALGRTKNQCNFKREDSSEFCKKHMIKHDFGTINNPIVKVRKTKKSEESTTASVVKTSTTKKPTTIGSVEPTRVVKNTQKDEDHDSEMELPEVDDSSSASSSEEEDDEPLSSFVKGVVATEAKESSSEEESSDEDEDEESSSEEEDDEPLSSVVKKTAATNEESEESSDSSSEEEESSDEDDDE
jgi:hypothetical protein